MTIALEIGTHKIACWIGKQPTEIIGAGYAISDGYYAGTIQSLQALEIAVFHTIQEAEKTAGKRIKFLDLVVNGPCVFSTHHKIQHTVQGGGTVTQQDICAPMKVLKSFAKGRSQLLHCFPLTYQLDDQKNITNPLGMLGQNLYVTYHAIWLKSDILNNITFLLKRMDIRIKHVVHGGYFGALACLKEHEKSLGSTCVDIGAGSITLTSFYNNQLTDTSNIPIGGRHITQDLMCAFPSLTFDNAERLKILCTLEYVSGQNFHALPPKKIQKVMQARLKEISQLVHARVQTLKPGYFLQRQLVLTGGSSQFLGLDHQWELDMLSTSTAVRMGILPRLKGIAQTERLEFAQLCGYFLYKQNKSFDNSKSFVKKWLPWLKFS